MKPQSFIVALMLFSLSSIFNLTIFAQLPEEQTLWPNGMPGNPVKYKEEKIRNESVRQSSLSQKNRIFSCVSMPTYVIHSPEKGENTGVAMVICPGGGFRDVWFDREGNDLGLWLAQKGITSLVLKYRTFNSEEEGFKLSRDDYNQHVYADARQAIYILRSRAKELGINVSNIGIGGFSAGGTLSLMAVIGMFQDKLPSYVNFGKINTDPDFVGLFYPGLNPGLISQAGKSETFPPVYIMNGGEDSVTPAANCVELYNILTSRKISVEMHIYSKGGHGFDSGIERGNGIAMWRDSFFSWLKDRGFVPE